MMERILHKRREYYQAHGLRTGQCCEIQEIFSELWEYVLYAKKLTLFFMCEFVKIIIVSMIHKASKDLFICVFVIKMTKLNCTKRFLPWEFYFLDHHDDSSNVAFLVLWCIRSVYYRIWKKIGYPKLEFWVLGIS